MVWHGGKIYVADAINNRIQVFSGEGELLEILGSPEEPLSLHFPYDIALGVDGSLYVVEFGGCRTSKVGLEGRLLGRFGTAGGGRGELHTPWGIAVDSEMRMLIADTGNRRIVELKI
jgi:DNA-binding beta-propeller fold protein YncE